MIGSFYLASNKFLPCGPVFAGTAAGGLTEGVGEMGGISKSDLVTDLAYGQRRADKQCFWLFYGF